MAYAIATDNNVYNIAANLLEKDDLNVSYDIYNAIEISDEDFLKVKKNLAKITISGDTATITSLEGPFILDEEALKNYIDIVLDKINLFIAAGNTEKILYSDINEYKNYLDNLNLSTITFPLDSTWEQYCEDNEITYFHTLQIP